jgi:hypothetical protein
MVMNLLAGSSERDNEMLGSINGRRFLHLLRDALASEIEVSSI